MDGKTVLKWAAILFVIWFLWGRISGYFDSGINVGDGGAIYPGWGNTGYLYGPGPVYGWAPPYVARGGNPGKVSRWENGRGYGGKRGW